MELDPADWGTRRRRRFAPEKWAPLLCTAVWDETPDVRTFQLLPADGSQIEHVAGQFMTLEIDMPVGRVERCYTISSSAARDGAIEITVKRQAGKASAQLHDVLRPGVQINAFGPSGRFGPAVFPGRQFALIAAGTGITPMLSILRTAADRGLALDVVLVQVAQTEADMVGADEFRTLARRLPGLRHISVTTRTAGAVRPTPEILRTLLPDFADRTVLCCGPQAFMDMVRTTAYEAGVPAERYGEESFDFSSPVLPVSATPDAAVRTVTFARTARTFACPESSTILAAVKAAGLPLPSSCARGMCGTCKTFKHAGEVIMVHEGGIRQREIDRGFILPCVSRPLTDIVLDC